MLIKVSSVVIWSQAFNVNLVKVYEWYVENSDTRTLAHLQVLQSKLNHPRQ